MAIQFVCPQCKVASQVKDELAGRSIRCKCGQVSVVGAAQPAPVAVKQTAAKQTATAGVAKPQPSAKVPAKAPAAAPTKGGLFGLSDDVWNQVNSQREAEEKRAAEKAAPAKKEANAYMTSAGASEPRIVHKTTDEIRKAQGILGFVECSP